MPSDSKSFECCILGAGPAGFGAAVELVKHGIRDILVLDRNANVGGLARTEEMGGARFDVGPHRFFTKNNEINHLWHETLGADFRPVDRLTRIYYKNKFFNYPIKAVDALVKMGPLESTHAMISFLSAKMKPQSEAETFEDWITQKFGRKLYETFFKTYTEKVWGIPCNQIGAEWAAQRIKGLDIIKVIKNSILGGRGNKIKTLVDQFDYPVMGAGQMYETMADNVTKQGVEVMLKTRLVRINCQEEKITSVDVVGPDGKESRIVARHYFSSIPITHFFKMLLPQAAENLRRASEALYYREHITVDLLVDAVDLFPDQWIYVHSPDVRMARVANYNNFSKAMVHHGKKTALSIEYFVFQTEDLWKKSDADLRGLAIDEMCRMGLLSKEKVEQAWVVRETESYPTYYIGFQEPYDVLKKAIDAFSNLSPIGRGGMYKYNNQDHSTLSGILAARNYLKLPGTPYSLWDINIDAEYHESAQRSNE